MYKENWSSKLLLLHQQSGWKCTVYKANASYPAIQSSKLSSMTWVGLYTNGDWTVLLMLLRVLLLW